MVKYVLSRHMGDFTERDGEMITICFLIAKLINQNPFVEVIVIVRLQSWG